MSGGAILLMLRQTILKPRQSPVRRFVQPGVCAYCGVKESAPCNMACPKRSINKPSIG